MRIAIDQPQYGPRCSRGDMDYMEDMTGIYVAIAGEFSDLQTPAKWLLGMAYEEGIVSDSKTCFGPRKPTAVKLAVCSNFHLTRKLPLIAIQSLRPCQRRWSLPS
jgi:hypothetical protein